MSRDTDIAWAAGLFEGEGYCGVPTSGQRQPNVSIAMTDEDVLRRFHAIIGCGNVTGPYSRGGNKPAWHWATRSRDGARQALSLMWPYLCDRRREQAMIVLERTGEMLTRFGPREFCRQGHNLSDPANIYVDPKYGKRHCRACRKLRTHEYYARMNGMVA